MSARGGRPPLREEERRRVLLSVRFSEEERRALDAAAKRSGESLSDWARRSLLDAATGAAGTQPIPRS